MNILEKRILVVDDSAMIRRYLSSILTGAGYAVEGAITGGEGIEKALATSFDLLLVDINMPVMNGYAMVAALRKEPATQSVPVIMSSTESKDQDASQAYACGANLFMVKPVEPDILKQYVKLVAGDII